MKKSFKNEIIHGICKDITYLGYGLVEHENHKILISGLFTNEEGDFELLYKKGDFYYGKIVKLTKVSPNRIQPKCKICSSCGGCCFQQLSYEAQLDFKTNLVKSQLLKVGHLDVTVNKTIGMDYPYFYRNKIQMPLGTDAKGNIYTGFYKEGTHVIVPVDVCYIESEKAKPVLDTIKKLLKSFKIKPYVEDERSGVLRHILIKTSFNKDEIMVVLVTNVDVFPSRNNFVKALTKAHPNIVTVVQNINSRDTNVILGNKEHILFGKGYIEDILCGVKFKISAKSFYQTNPVITEKLYNYAINSAKISKNDVVFDSYSGIGTIGLIASSKAKEVISVELVNEAVRDAISNSKLNGINNIKFICDDASSFISRLADENQKIDVLFMDPPRKGSDERFLRNVVKLKPDRVVYVSCNPSTLARDLVFLSKYYNIVDVQPFDMFPMTSHVETVACLRLKER